MNILKIIILVLLAISFLLDAYTHGKPKKGRYNFWLSIMPKIVLLMALYLGGFFNSESLF